MKVSEESCWAMTQAVELSGLGRSRSVVEFRLQVDCHFCIYIVSRIYPEFRLVQNLTFAEPPAT